MTLLVIREKQSINDLHRAYWTSKEYSDIMDFLQHGVLLLKEKGYGTSQIKNIYRKVYNFQLTL